MCIPLFVARQRIGKHVPAATCTRKYRRIVGRVAVDVYLPIVAR
jgi:hypothetical protein